MQFYKFLFLFLLPLKLGAQNGLVEEFFVNYQEDLLDEHKLILGLSVGMTLDLGYKRNSALRWFFSASLARTITDGEKADLIASIQSEVEFYRGGLGTSVLNRERSKIHVEIRNYPQLLLGVIDNSKMRGRPLVPSIGQSMSTLHDPFTASIGIGSCFINGINHNRNQQLGYAIVGAWVVQAYYYNDGPPYGLLGLGDRYDRWWTGGGGISIFFQNDRGFITDLGLRYDRFTGYQPHLYELANTLQINNLPYKEIEEQYYNQGRWQWRIGLRNLSHFTISQYNPRANDMQDYIHYITSAPFHIEPMDRFKTFGIEFQYRNIDFR